jgi:hypothetical protein
VPADHPIREIKRLADAALKEFDPVLDAMGRLPTLPYLSYHDQLIPAEKWSSGPDWRA